MGNSDSAIKQPAKPRKGKKYFTLEEAQRALPLVGRIAADVQATQAQRLAVHGQLGSGVAEFSAEATLRLQDQLAVQTSRLEGLIEELGKIGVELKDPVRGLVDFPAWHQGREILLCWKAGEKTVAHWHEMDAGFNSRRPVADML